MSRIHALSRRLLLVVRRLVVGTEWATVPVRTPVRLVTGELAIEGWVNRRVNPETLEVEYKTASDEDAENALWMWAIK